MSRSELPKNGSKIEWVSIVDYYDYPLTGWVKIGPRRFYFIVDDDAWWDSNGNLEWCVYEVTDRQLVAASLQGVRTFRNMVGWHWERNKLGIPGKYFSAEEKPNWRDFYLLPKGPEITAEHLNYIGVTKNFETFQRRLHNETI